MLGAESQTAVLDVCVVRVCTRADVKLSQLCAPRTRENASSISVFVTERDAPSDVTIRFRGKPDLVRSEEEPLPPGVRIYRRAVPLTVIEQVLPELEQRVAEDRKSRPITAGQSDRKRTQLKVDASEEIGLALLKALHRCGELHGRNHREG